MDPSDSGSSISPSPMKAHTLRPSVSTRPRSCRYFMNRAWKIAIKGPRPMDTVGYCQKPGISQGCGYDERPPGRASRRNLSSSSSLRRPSRKARAYIPGDECPWIMTRSPPCCSDGAWKKWLKPTS